MKKLSDLLGSMVTERYPLGTNPRRQESPVAPASSKTSTKQAWTDAERKKVYSPEAPCNWRPEGVRRTNFTHSFILLVVIKGQVLC